MIRAILTAVLLGSMFAYATYKPDVRKVEMPGAEQALQIASQLTGRTIPVSGPPVIILIDSQQLWNELACYGNNGCMTAGFYTMSPSPPTIYLNSNTVDVKTLHGFSYLIHEMVHHLQGNELYNAETCPKLEQEAYNAQEKFLSDNGYKLNAPTEYLVKKSCKKLQN